MPEAISDDLRERIVLALAQDMLPTQTKVEFMKAIAERFIVSVSTVYRIQKKVSENESIKAKPRSGGRSKQKLFEEHYQAIAKWAKEHNDATLQEHCNQLHAAFGISLSLGRMCRILQEMKLTRKKKRSPTSGKSGPMSKPPESGGKSSS